MKSFRILCFLYKIIWIVLCHSAMKHKNEVSGIIGCFQVVTIYSLWKKCYIHVHASYIVFLFVKLENNNFIKEIKHIILCAFRAWWKPWQSLWEFLSRWKPLTVSWVFVVLLLNSPKCSPQFLPLRLWKQGEHILIIS